MNSLKRRLALGLMGMSVALVGSLAARSQEAFSERDFDKLLKDTKYAVVMFYNAGWTGDLVAKLESAEAAFHRVSKLEFYEKTGVQFFAVDISRDNLARVGKSYNVQGNEPTFMVFKNGIPLAGEGRKEAQLNGFASAADIEAFIDQYFYDELLELYNQDRVVRSSVIVHQPETRIIQRVRYVDQPYYYDDYGYNRRSGIGIGLGGLGIGLGVGYGVGRYNRGGFYGGGRGWRGHRGGGWGRGGSWGRGGGRGWRRR